jgi:hypothetical protein
MNKSGYEEKKWHACHPLSLVENSQKIQHDGIFRRGRSSFKPEIYTEYGIASGSLL